MWNMSCGIYERGEVANIFRNVYSTHSFGLGIFLKGIYVVIKKMKYDILEAFRENLLETLNPNTAMTYYRAVEKLLKPVQFNSLSQLKKEWLLRETEARFRTKSEYSAVKNGLIRLQQFDSSLMLPSEEEFRNISRRKRNFSKKPKKVIYLKPTQRKINQIQDEKLKYAYRLAMISGLRVSELADLEAFDITFAGEKIFVNVRHGKGGHGGLIECREDTYLRERLPAFLEKNSEGKIFYSANQMKKCANHLGMECHDLRRIFAIKLRDELKKEMPVEEANSIVQEQMRHARFSTTKRYLFNRKLKLEYESPPQEEKVSDDQEPEKL